MTHFLADDVNPEGYKLEDLLFRLRQDMIIRMSKLSDDRRLEAERVFENDVAILDHLTKAIALAEQNSKILLQAFGPPKSGHPRIGNL